jgi:hypothetical protein
VRFAYVTVLRAKGKQTRMCILQTKNITDIGTEIASYKLLPLGNNVYSVDSKGLPYLLPLPAPLTTLPFNSNVERIDSSRLLYYAGICLKGLTKTMGILSQDSRSPGRDLNPGPTEYDSASTFG